MSYRYEINEANEIYAWADSSTIPFLYQPTKPEGAAWKDRKEAEDWVKSVIQELEAADSINNTAKESAE